MIPLEGLQFELTRDGRSWDLSDCFPSMQANVTLHERLDSDRRLTPFSNDSQIGDAHRTSRSYSGRFAIEVVSQKQCGIDLEIATQQRGDWSINSQMFELAMLAPGEKDSILSSSFGLDENLATQIWVSKEALTKALGDASKYEPSKIFSPICWVEQSQSNWKASQADFLTEQSERLITWLVLEK